MDKEDETYIYTMEYYLAIKNNKIISFAATWMQLEIIIPSEVRKTNPYLYVETKTQHKWTYTNRNRLTDTENRLVAAKGEGEEEPAGNLLVDANIENG